MGRGLEGVVLRCLVGRRLPVVAQTLVLLMEGNCLRRDELEQSTILAPFQDLVEESFPGREVVQEE